MILLYHIAPEDNRAGEYELKVYAKIDSEILTVSSSFKLGELDYSQVSIEKEVKEYTMVLKHQKGILHSPGNRLAIYFKILKIEKQLSLT